MGAFLHDGKFDSSRAGGEQVDYDALMRESDVISFHVILTKETRHMLGPRELRLMNPGAVIINNSRGPVIDEPELIKALEKDRIAGAALAVFEKEPVDPDNPLLEMDDRVFVTRRGEVPEHLFNPDVLPRLRERFEGRSLI